MTSIETTLTPPRRVTGEIAPAASIKQLFTVSAHSGCRINAESAVPALKYSPSEPEPAPSFPLPALDFRGLRFDKPLCETRPLAAQRNDHDLVVRLGRMPVDLAAPLLRSSLPALDAPALLALIATTGEAHHVLIAQRPGLDWRVVRALLKTNNDKVLLALVRNGGIDLDSEDRERLERLAQDRPELHGALLERFGRPKGAPDAASRDSHSNLKLLALLRQGATSGFVTEAARRMNSAADGLNKTLHSSSAVPLALVFAAMGLDRAAFHHLLPFWQAAHDGQPVVSDGHRAVLASVFTLSRDEARRRLAAMIAAD